MLQLVVIEAISCLSMVILLVDQLVIQVFELLQAVLIFKKFLDCAFLAGKYLLNGGTRLVAIAAPKSAI